MNTSLFHKRAVRITLATLLAYGVLVATHEGEFWPFSIYPMFSQAGKPWNRAALRDVTGLPAESVWDTTNQAGLPGEPLALNRLNVNTNDIANYLSKTEIWNERRIEGLRSMLRRQLETRRLVLYQARGNIYDMNGADSIRVRFFPFFYMDADTTLVNQGLRRN